jgi:hypothetical protein
MFEPQHFAPMEQWLVHHMLIIHACYKNSDNYTASQQLLHWHFQIKYSVQYHQLTASKPESAASVLKRAPKKVIHTLKNIESGIEGESTKFYVESYRSIKHLT